MSFGILLPLVILLCSYVVQVTLVGAPVARPSNRLAIWISTFGQKPPGKEKLEARASAEASLPSPSASVCAAHCGAE